ncbi:MAG: SurA N-terminal domain [Planctomycetota bacterium]
MRTLICLLLAGAAGAADLLADAVLRHVNGEAVTIGDVRARNQLRLTDLARSGAQPPRSADESLRFSAATLDLLTDERLLVQEAERLGVVIDEARIARAVVEEARSTGRGQSLAAQAEARRHLERQQRIEAVVGLFESRTHHPARSEVAAEYERRKADFARPARAWVTAWAIRPASDAERRAAEDERLALLRDAQQAADPALRAAATAAMAAVLADGAGPREQDAATRGLAALLADAAARDDLDERDRGLVRRATGLRERAARERDRAACEAEAARVRALIAGLPADQREPALGDLARTAQGPNASGGGRIDALEPGRQGGAFDQAVFALPAGGLTEPFWHQGALWIVSVRTLEEARQRTLDEVAGEIETTLRRGRTAQVRERLVGVLRGRAVIQDRLPLAEALR